MEQLRAELSHLLGEKLSRVECVNEKADTALWSLYDSHGHPMPLLARSFTTPGLARQLAPASTPERWEQLKDQIVEALLAWHRQDSHGCVGVVDSTQENIWPSWYRQRVEVLWNTLNQFKNTGLTMQDKRILFRTRECLPKLFEGFNDNCVLVHGNFNLRSMLKDARTDQLVAVVGPGVMLWAPREYELFRLSDSALAEGLLWHYLQHAPVAESFIWRRWLYTLWDEVAQLVNTGHFSRTNFDLASKSLLPWIA